MTERERALMLKQEKLRRIKYEVYKLDPLLWLKDRFKEEPKSFKWSEYPFYDGHVWDGDKDPLAEAWQDVAHGNWVGVAAATGTAKTYWLSRLVFWFLDCFENSLVVTSAPKESQLTLNLWSEMFIVMDKFMALRPYTRLNKLKVFPEGNNLSPFISTAHSHLALGFVSNVGAEEQSATKAQGFHRKDMLIVCEETPGMHAAIMTAFQNTCTGKNNLIVAVGNPDSEMDELYKFNSLPNVKNYRISAYDYPNVVKGEELIPGAVTVQSIERRRDKYGEDSPLYLSRVRGITPSEGDNNLIKRGWIDACTLGHEKFTGVAEVANGYNAVGVDVSNSETGDKAALAWGRSNVLFRVQEFQCPNATHLAYNLMYEDWELEEKKYRKYNTLKLKDHPMLPECVGIDSVGVGVSTINAFIDLSMKVTSLAGGAGQWDEVIPLDHEKKPIYDFGNLRSQMYWELREDIRQLKVILDIQDRAMLEQLRKELTVARFALSAGAVVIESKDQIKKRLGGKSPNVADAVVYWNWVRKRYRANRMFLPVMGGN